MRCIPQFIGLILILACHAATPDVSASPRFPNPDNLIALLRQKNFAELESRLTVFQRAYQRDSRYETAAVIAFEAFGISDPALESNFNDWISAHPQSAAAHLAHGIFYTRNGWTRRGSKYIRDTSQQQLDGMIYFFALAKKDLEKLPALDSKLALGYKYLIRIAMALGNESETRYWLDRALEIDPNISGARRAYINSLRPEWGGSYGAMTAFANETRRYAANDKLNEVVRKLEGDILNKRGDERSSAGDNKGALEYYQGAAALIEDYVFLTDRGRIYKNLKQYDKALADFTRAMELNPNGLDAREYRGHTYMLIGRSREGFNDYIAAAERGDVWAQYTLGYMYQHGRDGVAKNADEAVKWYLRAATLGSAAGQFYLADMYMRANGVRQNDAEAVKWLRLAAAQGHDNAQNNLGLLLWYGRGVASDRKEAIKLWRMAAKSGSTEAKRNLEHLPNLWEKVLITLDDLADTLLNVFGQLRNLIFFIITEKMKEKMGSGLAMKYH